MRVRHQKELPPELEIWRKCTYACTRKNQRSPQRVIDFMFGSRVGFLGSADRMDLLPVEPNPIEAAARHFRKF